MSKYDDKIAKIKKNQKKLLEIAKEHIETDGKSFRKHAKVMVEVLKYDEKTVKKYEAVVEAQKLIKKYTKQILEAENVNEVKEIREKLNKCINKIKKEMKKRDIDEAVYNKYCEKANIFRKSIAQDIRYLKRKEKIKEIKKLNKKIDKLDKDDLKRLRKLIKNELEYGKRNIKKNKELNLVEKNPNIESILPNPENDSLYEDDDPMYVLQEEDLNDDDKKDLAREMTIVPKTEPEEKNDSLRLLSEITERKTPLGIKTYYCVEDYLKDRIGDFERDFSVENIDEYTGGIIKNLVIFNKNLPKIFRNKKRVKDMSVKYYILCRKPEFRAYIEYIRQNSSVTQNFKKAIKNSVLKEKEQYYEEEHNKVIEWIINFCKNNDKEIQYSKSIPMV